MWQSTKEMTFQNITKESVWAVLEDVNNWHKWDKDIEYAKLEGPFKNGAKFILKPKGGPTVKIDLLRAEPLKGYTDVTNFPLAKMYGIHDIIETNHGIKLTITIKIEGPLSWIWRKLVAEKIADEAEVQLKSMVEFINQK